MKRLVIFDLDGTLLDTSSGIIYSYTKTGQLLMLNKNEVENKQVVIGGPLKDGFTTLYNINNDDILESAVSTYRMIYQKYGINKFCSYNGIEDMLLALKENGFLIAVATLKYESYAIEMLKQAQLDQYFDIIHGWDGTDECTKAYIITRILYELNLSPKDALLVGDSVYDQRGANFADVDFLGVSYGFGIKVCDSVRNIGGIGIANSPDDVLHSILNLNI